MGADPISWTIMGLGLANQVMDGMQSADAARDQQRTADRQADNALKQGEENAKLIEAQVSRDKEVARSEVRRDLARANVALADAGVSSSTGSALEILSGAAADGRRNVAWLGYDGKLRAEQARYRGRSGAANYGSQASSAAARQRSAYSDLVLGGTSSLLSLGARAYG
ncbi:hypothetical protein [Desulfovibrio ferrophilus]|uniref:Phage protein n=1 Tax=Desulfovibrio ferrophilus TaxID=241368 RepID=A0A2Z6AZY0_9BACT|nr:hypothetical protein [Desulfovibrio ferrophilus]BBD08745.1 putative uncharacterized protein [Desulfovibrio ferrophilus]